MLIRAGCRVACLESQHPGKLKQEDSKFEPSLSSLVT